MPYAQRVDRENPACFVFLVDQSFSMTEPCAGRPDQSKAEALADAINNLLYELVMRCVKNPSEGPRHYYDIAVIGYGGTIGPAWGGNLAGRDLVPIVDIANNAMRVDEKDRSTTGKSIKRPVWFDPIADGATPMAGAMDFCGAMVAGWVNAHPTSFPPIIINISDGAATDGDPVEWTRRLESLGTQDGNVLVFNVNISATEGAKLMFPSSPDQLPDKYAQQMFEMSSVLPGFMQEMAGMQGHQVGAGARGFVFNADITTVVNFLQIGTATHHVGV
ncbi:MAG: VWA domain-containing protein [Actinomycetia bacterium]|nr:VWA domain-containing protein [Actinomycetes bacterium]MCP3909434.1 VWA domain-containing protein [Actinomycetes bacterium]MCP5024722.1 VWA domain-containing protein [Actinomycetes bacterium]